MGNLAGLFSPMEWLKIDPELSKTEIMVLIVLYREQELRVSDIARRLTIPLSTTTSLIDRLERKKLVQRIRSNEDRRVVKIKLTGQGEKLYLQLVDTMEKMFSGLVEKITRDLTDEEIKFLEKIINKIAGKS